MAIGGNAKAYGDYSVAVGRQAGTTYNYANQIVIGAGSTSTGTNEIIIGSGSLSYGANTTHIGNSATTHTYLEGIVSGSNLVANDTDTYTSTAVVQQMVTLTAAEYSGLTPDANTFYIVI